MQQKPYTIYNASAGSGKTYTIAKSYLTLILRDERPLSFKQVLGITFTNKAVGEMKSRILKYLQGFADTPSHSEIKKLFEEVKILLGVEKSELQARSRKRLKELLHNYSYFDISTIDKFNHRLIRTFSKDLKLPSNFEVILNEKLFLKEAVDALLNQVGEDAELSDILVKYALEKIDSDTSWDISFDLIKSGEILFDETQLEALNHMASRKPSDFKELKKILKSKISECENSMKALAVAIFDQLEKNSISRLSFKGQYFPNYIDKIAQGAFPPPSNKVSGWILQFSENPLYAEKCPVEEKEKLDRIHPWLIDQFESIQQGLKAYYFWRNAYKNFLPLSVIHALNEQLRNLMLERSSLPISEFNKLISTAIKDQPVPFIYERIGEKYRHYFIDEFQDTSVLQWENLVPLVLNAMSSEDANEESGSLMLVGDSKQAIYRWRGGAAHQLIELYNEQENPFLQAPVKEPLEKNFRSSKEIVEFNNEFFTFNSQQLSNSIYRELYDQSSKQEVTKESQGWVQIQFLEGKNAQEMELAYCQQIETTLGEVLEKGYDLSDVCILTRSNKNAIAIAKYLNEKAIPVISSQSLLLQSDRSVQFLVDLLYASYQPNQTLYRASVLEYLVQDKGSLSSDFMKTGMKDFTKLLGTQYGFSFDIFRSLEVYDAVSYAINCFKLADTSSAYLYYFLDFIYEYFIKDHQGIVGLLNEWELQKDQLSIITPEGVNAVQLMTIHKAKGLQFPIVIYPFADQPLISKNSNKLWVPIEDQSHAGFKELLFSKNEALSSFSPESEAIVDRENQEMELDSFNVLYVALTRAEKGLIVLTKKEVLSSGAFVENHISSLFYRYLNHLQKWNNQQLAYNFGELVSNQSTTAKQSAKEVPYSYSDKLSSRYQLIPHASLIEDEAVLEAQLLGNKWHILMEHLGDERHIDHALDQLIASDPWVDIDHYKKQLESVITHPHLKAYYQAGVVYKNECSLFSKEGDLLRPDRLVFYDLNVVIIDYKTGAPSQKNRDQVNRYAQVLEEMGYAIQDKILLYIQEDSLTIQHIN